MKSMMGARNAMTNLGAMYEDPTGSGQKETVVSAHCSTFDTDEGFVFYNESDEDEENPIYTFITDEEQEYLSGWLADKANW